MSKIYDALLKAQKEQAAQEKELRSHEPQPKPQPVEPRQEAHQTTPFFDAVPEIIPKKATKKPPIPRKRIIRVNVGKFVAKPDSIMAEQFRKLRSSVTTHNLTSSLRSVLVTSCLPGEGKTKVVINLSATIAKGLDDSVILIDADLRRKSLSSLLGLRNTLGLSDVLAGKTGIQETLVNTEIKGLAVLPAGLKPPNPAEVIAPTRMKNLVQELTERLKSSYIIIDSVPIVSASEANVLSHLVDGIILVIMADKTRRDVVKRELKSIDSEKILGVVLNCAEFDTSEYHYSYYKPYS
jgi:capsular exopolysaccharide synthesis family protein